MMYSNTKHETKCLGFDSPENSKGAKHRLSSLAVFFCAELARLYSLWAGASADAFMRAGVLLSQSVNPLVTRPPYLTVGSGVIQTFKRRTLNA